MSTGLQIVQVAKAEFENKDEVIVAVVQVGNNGEGERIERVIRPRPS